ncbi:hypothetical protein AYO22_10977 [Fonsecaea multimorphosa]|nr:hypothetical protein AYO22_10977 [Fonsecaea multimorphosa]
MTVGQTISIDLTQAWTNATVQNYAKETQRPVTDGHWSKKPALFYNPSSNVIVQWGGWPYNNGDQSYEFVFTPNANGTVNWIQSTTPVTNSQNQTSPAVFGSAFVSSNLALYSLGGVMAEPSAPPDLAVPGLLEYNFAGNNWTNTSSLNASTNGYLVGAQAAYTPGTDEGGFGSAGYLVFIGGSDPATQYLDPQSPSLVDMSNITLYDLGGQTWYHQTTTGTIPPPRQFFCSVSATSIQATFEIFILGGSTNDTYDQAHTNDTDYLNVYTLSIPAFRWFKSSASDQVRRADHSCQLIGNKQMLVIGGIQPGNPLGIAAIDPWPNGLGIFDMSNFTWAHGYDPHAPPYEQPEVVRDYYSTQYQSPIWGAPQLEADFAWAPPDLPTGTYTGSYSSATSTSATSSKVTSTTTATANPSAKSSSSSSHTGAIVGGVVGAVCAVLLVLILVVLLRRHKSANTQGEKDRKAQQDTPDVTSVVPPKSEMEAPLPSPGFGMLPSYSDRRESDVLPELSNPGAQELEANSVRWSHTPEMPAR